MVIVEGTEISLQLLAFDTMARTSDLFYVITSGIILSLNLIATPVGFMVSVLYSDRDGRHIIYITDAWFESAYLFLNLHMATRDNLLQLSVLLSILFPLCSLLVKVEDFVEHIATYM